ncbi:MAG: hypothetical protein JO233_04635 [Candidatus Eremiobacteraeota bacterium]|nr:hypothetical protein [Candidatus Eremiobacteraeota bacterium]
MAALLRRPSAFLPLAISTFLIALILIRVARFGIVHETDEGTEAHLFQLLMPAQGAIIAFFAVTWLHKKPTAAAQVLVLQIAAALSVLALVFVFRL